MIPIVLPSPALLNVSAMAGRNVRDPDNYRIELIETG